MEDGKFYEGGAVRRVKNALSVKRFMDKVSFCVNEIGKFMVYSGFHFCNRWCII